MDAYWRAANYLSAGQLYLLDNPLLTKPLDMSQIKKKIDSLLRMEAEVNKVKEGK